MNIDPKDFLLAILRGDLYSTTPLPLELCNKIQEELCNLDNTLKYSKQPIIFDRPSEAAQFCNVYSPEGWRNELDRREYMVRLHLPPQRTVDEVKKEMLAAVTLGDMDLVLKLKKELEGIK